MSVVKVNRTKKGHAKCPACNIGEFTLFILEMKQLPLCAFCPGRRPLRPCLSGHLAQTQRPPNQRPDLGSITHRVVLRSTLQDCVGRNLIVQDHGAPTGRFPLGADKGAELHLTPFLQDLKEELHLPFVRKGVEQEVIQYEQILAADLLQLLLVLVVVLFLQNNQRLQQLLTVLVDDPVFGAGRDAQCLSQIGLAAVRGTQDTDI